jgi:hypothetical protein
MILEALDTLEEGGAGAGAGTGAGAGGEATAGRKEGRTSYHNRVSAEQLEAYKRAETLDAKVAEALKVVGIRSAQFESKYVPLSIYLFMYCLLACLPFCLRPFMHSLSFFHSSSHACMHA